MARVLGERSPGYDFGQAKKAAFLASYRYLGNITLACEAADMPRSLYYVWTEKDEHFSLNVEQCKIEAIERLEAVAHKRAVEGVDKRTGVYYLGKMVGEQLETQYSDTCLIFLLKGLAPEKYRERASFDVHGSVTVGDSLSTDELAGIRQALLSAGSR